MSAFRPADRRLRLTAHSMQRRDAGKLVKFRVPWLHRDGDKCARAAEDLERCQGPAEGLLEEPPVHLQLEQDLGVILFCDPTRHLRVSNQVPFTIPDEEVRSTDDLAGRARQRGLGAECPLVDERLSTPYGFASPGRSFWDTHIAQVEVRSKLAKMVALEPFAEPAENPLIRSGRLSGFVTLPQEHS